MDYDHDTIVAVATGAGVGAVAVLRVSGGGAKKIAAEVLRLPSGESVKWRAGRVKVCNLVDSDGRIVDEVVASFFSAPRSYTGEDVLEVSGHGGVLVTRAVLERLRSAGARSADAGEFTKRAFLAGKMDLTQAEAVMDLIAAKSDLALRAAREHLIGGLGAEIESLRDDLLNVLAQVEAVIDFPDEGIEAQGGSFLRSRTAGIMERVEGLLAGADKGRLLREGARVVIAGEPNVGKSSLLNLLAGFERAIVDEQAGTTRDMVDVNVQLGGVPVQVTDTAGLRETGDRVEARGVELAREAMAAADLVLRVVDGSVADAGSGEVEVDVDVQGELLVLNKADLGEDACWRGVDAVRLSCKTAAGGDALVDAICARLLGGVGLVADELVTINARHRGCLERARWGLAAAGEALERDESPEFVAVDLREALDAIGEVVGGVGVEDLLGEIFGNFCIGK